MIIQVLHCPSCQGSNIVKYGLYGLSAELDERWSYVRSTANPRWLWHAIDHPTGTV